MQDTELYQQVLGLVAPWSVDRVELDVDEGWIVAGRPRLGNGAASGRGSPPSEHQHPIRLSAKVNVFTPRRALVCSGSDLIHLPATQ